MLLCSCLEAVQVGSRAMPGAPHTARRTLNKPQCTAHCTAHCTAQHTNVVKLEALGLRHSQHQATVAVEGGRQVLLGRLTAHQDGLVGAKLDLYTGQGQGRMLSLLACSMLASMMLDVFTGSCKVAQLATQP